MEETTSIVIEETAAPAEKVEAPAKEAEKLGEFKIVTDGKRTIKTSCSGQMIEALKRSKNPLSLAALASRVRLTKAGKELKVKDVKSRVAQCANWYVKDDNQWVKQNELGEYYLARS